MSRPRRRTIPRIGVAGAVAAAFVANVVATTATDQLFHVVGVFPPWGQAMPHAGDNAPALAYRTGARRR